MNFHQFSLSFALAATLAAPAFAQSINVKDAWARASVPGQMGTGAFMKITAKEGSRLVGASSPVAGVTEVHEMKMDGNVMKMRAVEGGLELPAGKTVELKPGSFHLMFLKPKRPLVEGEVLKGRLVFEKAGPVPVEFKVEGMGGNRATQPAGSGGGHTGHVH